MKLPIEILKSDIKIHLQLQKIYQTIDKVFWVPRGKPDGVGGKNPSDVIIKLSDGNYIGYSNKIAMVKMQPQKLIQI